MKTSLKLPKKVVIFLLLGLFLVACQDNPLLAPTPSLPPPTATAEPTSTPLPDPATAAGFDYFLKQVEATRAPDRPALVNRYLAELTTPITDGTQAIFLWRGAAQSVQLVGDMNNWDPEGGPALSRVEGTELWYWKGDYEADARLDYKFIVNGGTWQLDPLNPRTIRGGFGPNSEMVMPGYETPPDLLPDSSPVAAGTVTQHTLDSASLNQTRTFYVYTPASQLIGAKYPSIYFDDGGDYLNLIDTPAILDRLIASRVIPPLVAVFIPPINRNQEYNRSDAYASFLADELVPFVRATYDTDPDPAKTATVGSSMGGLMAVYTAITRPDAFGLVLGQSGAYSLDGYAIIGQVATRPMQPVRLYLVVGSYETAVSGNSEEGNLLAANRRLAEALQGRSYVVRFEERPEGHSWGLWRGTLGRGLRFLYAGEIGD